jgi:glycosyltransferase involved in cell wall biosynthesis
MTADFHLHLAMTDGMRQQRQRYSLVAWPWEMERWPSSLADALLLADECWPFSHIIEVALKSIRDSQPNSETELASRLIPVVRMPPVVELGPNNSPVSMKNRVKTRQQFGLPQDAILFTFSFDLNSTVSRKNPLAVITAFCKAFPTEDTSKPFPVALIVKTFPPKRKEPAWEELKAIASSDSRIQIVEANLGRHAILELYGCCDIFISLHRSEGLGRGLAEALQLGLDVFATDNGGNTDFCTGPLTHPIDYKLIPVKPGEYPHHKGMMWAEPNLQQAVAVMREVARIRYNSPTPDPEGVAEYKRRFSAETVGARYRDRLVELWQSRLQIQKMIDMSHEIRADDSTANSDRWQR